MTNESLAELMDSVRTKLQAELDAQLQALATGYDAAVKTARDQAEAEAEQRFSALIPAAPPEDPTAAVVAAMTRIDEARSAVGLLNAIAAAAADCVAGALLFVGPQLDRWPSPGQSAPTTESARRLARESYGTGRVIRKDGEVAAPLLLDGEAVAVLCAVAADTEAAPNAIESIARHGAARLGAFTAVRVAQAQRWLAAPGGRSAEAVRAPAAPKPADVSEDEDVQSARRYARLLVSEIKLYNETAVTEGRVRRDLSRRLGSEIDRARRLYEERVPSTIADRGRYFEHELIQTLAGGDPALLG